MAASSSINLRLSPEAAAIIEDAVEFGEAASPEALVEEAVIFWHRQREDRLIEAIGGIEVVRRLVEEGLESGTAGPLDIEKIIAEGRRRLGQAAE